MDGWIYKRRLCWGNLEVLDFTRQQSVSFQCPHWYPVILVLVFSYIHNVVSERKLDNGEMSPFNFCIFELIKWNVNLFNFMTLEVTFTNAIITTKYYYFGWIRSFLDSHFLVYSYNKSGILHPDSSFVKVSFTLCCVDFYYYVVKVLLVGRRRMLYTRLNYWASRLITNPNVMWQLLWKHTE